MSRGRQSAPIPTGTNLSQTLLLALHPAIQDPTSDLPSWERSPLSVADLQMVPSPATGCCDRYTRLTRAVLLAAHPSQGAVKWVHFAEGRALEEDKNAPDPMVSLRQGSNGLTKLTFVEGRALWRDLAAFLPDATGTLAHPAAVLSWAQNLMDAGNMTDANLNVLVAGQASTPGQMKILRARSERFAMPNAALCQADTAQVLRAEISRCDQLYRDIRTIATVLLARTMPDPTSKDTRTRARAVLDAGPFAATFFASAERRLPMLLRLIGQADLDAAHAEWSAALLQAANGAWDAARGMLGQSAAALRAEALTHGKLLAALRPLRPEPDPATIQEPTNAEEATP